MSKEISIIIRARDLTRRAFSSVTAGAKRLGGTFKSFGSGLKSMFAGAGKAVSGGVKSILGALGGFQAQLIGIGGAVAGFAASIKKAFEFERYTTQFKVLFGDLETAKRHINDLKEFSSGTPFQFANIAKASRQLHTFTDGVMGATDSLKLVGDAASATNQPIEDVAFWVGRAYSAISAGRPFGEAAMRLQEMSLLSGTARNEIEKLTKAGASNSVIWGVLQKELERYEGGMRDMSQTGEGLFTTLRDDWNLALAAFGEAFQSLAKTHIVNLITKLRELRENGDIAVWAEKTISAMRSVAGVAKRVGGWIGWLSEKIKDAAAFWGTLSTKGLFSDTGSSLEEATGAMFSREKDEQANEQAIRDEARQKAQADKQNAKQEADLKSRLATDLAAKELAAKEDNVDKAGEKEKDKIAELAKDKLDQLNAILEDTSTHEAELDAANIEKKKELEIKAVDEVAAHRASVESLPSRGFRAADFAGESITAATVDKYGLRQIGLATAAEAKRIEAIVGALQKAMGGGDGKAQTKLLENIATHTHDTAKTIGKALQMG